MDRKKQLKLEYKMNPRPMGVYQIRNLVNGKVYVNGSMNLTGSQNGYRQYLAMNAQSMSGVQAEWKEYGEENFVFEVLETLDINELPQDMWRAAVDEMEARWLQKIQPYGEKGYNKAKR